MMLLNSDVALQMHLHDWRATVRPQMPGHRWPLAMLASTLLALLLIPTSAAKAGTLIDESPYYVPGVSNTPFNFSGIGRELSGAFRVLGARTLGLSLTFSHAEASCRALEGGRGLAIVNTGQRREALNAAIARSLVRHPSHHDGSVHNTL